jgi:hypothetical protein
VRVIAHAAAGGRIFAGEDDPGHVTAPADVWSAALVKLS